MSETIQIPNRTCDYKPDLFSDNNRYWFKEGVYYYGDGDKPYRIEVINGKVGTVNDNDDWGMHDTRAQRGYQRWLKNALPVEKKRKSPAWVPPGTIPDIDFDDVDLT